MCKIFVGCHVVYICGFSVTSLSSTLCHKKTAFYKSNNSAQSEPISILCGVQKPEEISKRKFLTHLLCMNNVDTVLCETQN